MPLFGFFDATDYNSAKFSKIEDMKFTGIAPGYEDELEVTLGTGLQVIISAGGMASRGRYYVQNDGETVDLPIDAATTDYLRKDRVVIEFDVTNQTIAAKISKGTEASSDPAAPDLVDTTTKWEIPLAIVNVNGSGIDSVDDDRVIYGARTNTDVDTAQIIDGAVEPSKTSGFAFCERQTNADIVATNGTVYFPTKIFDDNNIYSAPYFIVPTTGDWVIDFDAKALNSSASEDTVWASVEIYNSSDELQRQYVKYNQLVGSASGSVEHHRKTRLHEGEKVILTLSGLAPAITILSGANFTMKQLPSE